MKITKILLVVCLLLFSYGFGIGQVSITAYFIGNPQVVTLQDLNLLSPGSTELFNMNLNNSGEEQSFKLNIVIRKDTEILAQGTTEPFPLGSMNITNKNLNSELTLTDFSISGEDLIDKMLATGSLPDGRYEFVLTVTQVNNPSNTDNTIIVLDISNPTTMQLIYPGVPVDQVELTDVYNPQPTFVWEGNSNNYTIVVVDGTGQDPESAISSSPYMWTQSGIMSKTITFPSNAPFNFENGKTYYWQVKAAVALSGGNVDDLESEIWGFIYREDASQIENYLISLLERIEELQPVLEAMKEDDYLPTGRFWYKNQEMTLAGLLTIIRLIESGDLEVTEIIE